MSVNRAILIGRVGKDPEIRASKMGKDIASFSLATSESWKDKSGERKEVTTWHNIVVFNEGLAGVVKNYVKKGSQLYVEGAIQNRKWQDNEGADRYITEIVLQAYGGTLQLLGGGDKSSPSAHDDAKQNAYMPAAGGANNLDDDIPF